MSRAVDHIVVSIYNFAIIAGTAWLVWHGWSKWWFLVALLFMARSSLERSL